MKTGLIILIISIFLFCGTIIILVLTKLSAKKQPAFIIPSKKPIATINPNQTTTPTQTTLTTRPTQSPTQTTLTTSPTLTQTNTPQPPPLINMISFETYGAQDYMIISELFIYDENMNRILNCIAILSPPLTPGDISIGSAMKVFDGNFLNSAVPGRLPMQHPTNYLVYKTNDSNNKSSPEHISWVPSINQFVFVKKFDSTLIMISLDGTQVKSLDLIDYNIKASANLLGFASASGSIQPDKKLSEELFNPLNWNYYTTVDANLYRVEQKSNIDYGKQNLKYIKIILPTPQKIRKIVIVPARFRDSKGEEFNNIYCKTYTQNRTEISNVLLSDPNYVYYLHYDVYTGKKIATYSDRIYYPYLSLSSFWTEIQGNLTKCQWIIRKANVIKTDTNMPNLDPTQVLMPKPIKDLLQGIEDLSNMEEEKEKDVGDILYGLNSEGKIYVSPNQGGDWRSPLTVGKIVDIAGSSKYLAVINEFRNLYYRDAFGPWNTLDDWKGGLETSITKIKFDTINNKLYSIGTQNDAHCYENIKEPTDMNLFIGPYETDPDVIDICACNDKICAIGTDDEIYYSTWEQYEKDGVFTKLSKLIIRDSNGYIFYTDLYDPKFISNTTWIQLPGANWASITTNNGLLCATTTTGKIYINSKTKFKDIWEAL